MSSGDSNATGSAPASEVFALTDEQIVGLEAGTASEEGSFNSEERRGAERRGEDNRRSLRAEALSYNATFRNAQGTRDDQSDQAKGRPAEEQGRAQAGVPVPQEEGAQTSVSVPQVPGWLAEKMRDPWCGDEAKELWDGKQKAEAENAAYREVFATAEDARALKDIYPGGVAEAKSAAERARALDAIDAAFYRGDAAARTGLAQKMMRDNPAAFREMVEVGLALLRAGQPTAVSQQPTATVRGAEYLAAEAATHKAEEVPPEVVRAYGEFEKAANAELEKSVGGAIARVIEDALPNLRVSGASGREGAHSAAPLRDRLGNAVREEVDAALRSDRALGEQVARVLAGHRFDAATRAQVVRLIDARAQQLVPGAVKRVVGSWTSATLGAHGKHENTERTTRAGSATKESREVARAEKPVPRRESGVRGRRLDYGRMSDEEILGM